MTELASGIHDRSNALSTVAFRLEQSLLDAVSHDMTANPVLVRMMDANRAVRETRRASRAILEYPDVREVAAAWRRCCRSRHPHLWNKATVATALYAKPNTKAMKRLQAEDCPAHKAA